MIGRIKESMKCGIPKRLIVTILACLGYFTTFSLRLNLSVTIVAMTNDTTQLTSNSSFSLSECPLQDEETAQSHATQFQGNRYDWDSTTQGYIQSAFFYTYFITNPLGGYLAERCGAARILGASILIAAILTLLTPVVVSCGLLPTIAVRALVGFLLGAVCPAMTVLISRWSPKLERSRISSIVTSGYFLGTMVTLAVSGWLCSIDFLGGWPSVFYVSGSFGCMWSLLWIIFVYETPYQHPNITKEELLLFEEDTYVQRKTVKVPWRAMLTSLPFWSFSIATFGEFFIESILFVELPIYFANVLQFKIEAVGFLLALPYILKCLSVWIGSYVADRLRKSEKLSITTIRKIFNSLAAFGIALSLIAMIESGCNLTLVVTLMCLGVSVESLKLAGCYVTPIDMCPDFSGTVFGIANSIGSLSGIVAPAMSGVLTSTGPTIANWRKVFYISAAVSTLSGLFFALFASAELQPWGKATYLDKPDVKKMPKSDKEYKERY